MSRIRPTAAGDTAPSAASGPCVPSGARGIADSRPPHSAQRGARWWEEALHLVTGRVRRHDALPDLRELESRSIALERTHYVVNDRERSGRERRVYVLRAAPTRRDPVAIAVSSHGRRVGYLPRRVARGYWPLLTRIGGEAIVNGAGTKGDSIRLWVDVPTQEAWERFVSGSRVALLHDAHDGEVSGVSRSG